MSRPGGSGCLGVVMALLLLPAGCALTPMVLFQQANGVTLEQEHVVAGSPLDSHGVVAHPAPVGACGAAPPSSYSLHLSPPLTGPVSSPYGWRPNPTGWGWDCHTGVDWAVEEGTPVRAAASGMVAAAGWAGNYGRLVRLDHGQLGTGQAVETWYAHLSAVLVEPGQRVPVGAVIGHTGNTGRSTGPHLHFEVRVDGRPVDPLAVLAGDESP